MEARPKDSVPESPEVQAQPFIEAVDQMARQAARMFDTPLEMLAPHLAEFDGFVHAHQDA